MQKYIDEIVYSNVDKNQKILNLKNILFDNCIFYFSDFDDTLTSNTNVFYTKVKLLIKLNLFNKNKILKLLDTFILNKSYPTLDKKIVIISRNNHDFLKFFLEYYKNILEKKWIFIVWVIWNTSDFKFSSSDKVLFLNENSHFIWDSFEDTKLQKFKNFINVDNYNKKSIFIKIKKIFYLFLFIVKWF